MFGIDLSNILTEPDRTIIFLEVQPFFITRKKSRDIYFTIQKKLNFNFGPFFILVKYDLIPGFS